MTAEPGGSRTCRACGGKLGPERIDLREMMFGTRGSYAYASCVVCGSLSILQVPDDLARHYPAAYYSNHARVDVDQDPAWRRWLIRSLVARRAFGQRSVVLPLARRLARVPTQYGTVRSIVEGSGLSSFDDPVLDVGCGAKPGRLAVLRKLGFRSLMGVEPFLDADTAYQGVPVRKGMLEDVEGTFALIMFHHSLEHVPDPVGTLQATTARLRRGGRVLVRTPIMGTHFWRTYGRDWVELDAPRHLVLFTVAGLERAAATAGLEVERISWESGAWEFVASEQYRRDIAMSEPASWFVDRSAGGFDDATLEAFKAHARRLNEAGDAGRAAIWLRPAG